MSDKEIVEIMIAKVEEIVRSKVKEDFNEAKTLDKKNVAKAIIKELEQVMQDENKKRIEYENFRNFKKAGAVDCSTDGKVTIIYGENGAGKTTFHQLFQWIIYGQVHFNKTASDKMYNLELEQNASIDEQFSVKGAIDFIHSGEEYTIRREWIYQKTMYETKRISTSFTISKKDKNRNWVRLPNPDEVVEQLLPSGLADYFFFDGESMITDLKAKGKDSANSLRDALYLMLDLSVYDKAVKYIGQQDRTTTTLGTLFMSQTGTGSDANLITLGQQMEQAQGARDRQEEEEEKLEKEINRLEDRIKKISEQIGGAKSQREYETMRIQAKGLRDEYLGLAAREYQGFGDELISVFPKLMMSKVIEKASKTIKHKAENSNLLNGVNVPLIDALLQSAVCICGNPLTEKERETLRRMYDYLPPKGYDSLYQNFTDMAERWGREYNRQKLEGYIERALDDLEKARKQDEKIASIDEKMKQDKQHEDLVVERKKAEEKLRELKARKITIHEEAYKASLRVNKLKKEIDKASATMSENELIKRKIRIMEEVKSHFEAILQEKSLSYSKKLQETIQELLDEMLKAKRTVNVSADFSLRVADSYDDESKSEGQFATVSFAYIGGIFKLLKEEEILQNKEYPLVLDAPFSKLGDEPRQRVIDTIPRYAPQIILLSKDNLQNDFSEDMIGKVWTIVSNDEQNVAEIREGIFMEIRGDVNLKGEEWLKALKLLAPFFTQSSQPNYSIYAISMSIGIMYDKQSDIAGEETDECKENPKSVPRTVLYQHNLDLDFLFQAAILTSAQVTFTEDERMNLAFNEVCDISFDRMSFLTKFANFGVGKLLEQVADEPVETMQNIKKFLAATVEGYNYEIDSIPEDDFDLEDIE